MVASDLPEHLQFHGQAGETGALVVRREGAEGLMYLHGGNVVHAESGQTSGLAAFFILLTWEMPTVEWIPNQMAPRMTFNESIDSLLFQLVQLEDSGQANEETLISLYGAPETVGPQTQAQMTDLSHYTVSFQVMNTSFQGFEFFLNKPQTLLGRLDDCDVILPDGSVSSHHCRIHLEQTMIYLEDLGSTNGTFINAQMISHQAIQVGDAIMVGSVDLRMSLKLQRRLEVPANMEMTVQSTHSASAQVRQHKTNTGRIKGPITWKNIDGPQGPTGPTDASGNSLWGKMFKKK